MDYLHPMGRFGGRLSGPEDLSHVDYLHPVFRLLFSLFQPIFSPASDPERITQLFCWGILACFGICLVVGFWKKSALRFSQSTTTVLGILGTFVGIALGLNNFDANNIEQSVPPLLAGLKTAFLTSIVGIGTSLLTRIATPWMPLGARKDSEGATVQTLAELLQEQLEAGKENHEQTLESLESIRSSVSGEGDTSLLTQVTRLRTTFTDKQDELIKEFNDFAENMAEANSEKLIKALEEVMRDFNAKINEQFGDNFQQLNEGVGKLVKWQGNYAQQTEEMIDQFNKTVSTIEQVGDSIAQVRGSIAQIAEGSGAITEAAERLAPILTAIQEQRKYMEGYLSEFADISEKAGKLLPTLDAKITELTENFAEFVRQSIEENQKSLNEQKEFAQTVINGFSELDKAVTDAVEKAVQSCMQHIGHMRASVSEAEEQLKTIVSSLADRLHSSITETFGKTEKEITQLAQRSSDNIEARMNEIDKQLEAELTKVLNGFGDRLVTISERFADDYTPLADKLKEVLDILERGAERG